MSFTLLMLLTMLFAPIVLNKLYPIDGSVSSIQDAWSLSENKSTINTITPGHPFWVELYRSYEVTPAILCFLFFVAMISFIKPKVKESELQTSIPEVKPKTTQDEIKEKRNYKKSKIKECETRIDELRNKLTESLASNTIQINSVLRSLEAAKTEILAIDKRITELNVIIKVLLKTVDKELNFYQTEYLDILSNDHIKCNFITPVWPDTGGNDIIQYYKN